MLRVLIVDDECPVHEAFRLMLDWKALGYACPDSAMDGEEALDMLRRERYDVVITDIRMPNIDGIAFMHTLKSVNADMRILVVTGYDLFSYAQEAIRCGAKDCFLKPVDRHELETCMRKIAEEIDQSRGLGDGKATLRLQKGELVTRVVQYLDNCFRQEISVGKIARMFYVNPTYLGQQFRKATGMTINAYVNIKRVDWVKALVLREDVFTQEAIRTAGYQNCGYFYRKFQELEGVSFAQWRQRIKQD